MNLAGRILVLASAGISLLSMFVPYFDYDDGETYTLWESLSRSDILMALMCVAAGVAGVLSLVMPRARVVHALTIAAGGVLFGIFGFYLVEYSPDRGYVAGALIGGIAGLLGLVGAVLLSAGATNLGTAPERSPQPSARQWPPQQPAPQPPPQPAAPVAPAATPPGWFPDPAGSGGQRYWDGRAWTDQVSGP